MRIVLLISVALILNSFQVNLFSQELNIVFEAGLGSYKMSDLKKINDIVLRSLAFDAKLTNSFPKYWFYKSSLLVPFKKIFTAGITCSYQSTGSYISRIDYSGEYYLNTKIRAISPGAIVEIHNPGDKFRISFSNEIGIEYSKLCLVEYLMINSESQEYTYTFSSTNYYYEPALKISYPVLFFRLGLTSGYSFDFKKEAFNSSDLKKYNLILPGGNPAKSDWSGLRLSASLAFNILQIFKSGS